MVRGRGAPNKNKPSTHTARPSGSPQICFLSSFFCLATLPACTSAKYTRYQSGSKNSRTSALATGGLTWCPISPLVFPHFEGQLTQANLSARTACPAHLLGYAFGLRPRPDTPGIHWAKKASELLPCLCYRECSAAESQHPDVGEHVSGASRCGEKNQPPHAFSKTACDTFFKKAKRIANH